MADEQTRREWLLTTGALAAAAMHPLPAKAQAPAAKYPRDLTKADIERWMTELSNWGRWGKDDQAGTFNLITPAKRRQAASLVKDGVSVSMSIDADLPKLGDPAPPPPAPAAPGGRAGARSPYTWEHVMRSNGIGRDEGYVIDTYTVTFHGNNTTHMDALSHYIHQGQTYNGFPGDATTAWGATKNDVMPFKNGIVTRGVLIDMPRLKGVPYLADDEAVYPEDLDAFEKKTGVKIESGDAVFLRTGRWRRVAERGPLNIGVATPGLYASCAKWLKQRDIAIFGSDSAQDVRPSRVDGVNQPIHQLLLVAVGTPLFDNCGLEALGDAADQRKRWTFMFTASPMLVPGGTGSPLNPIATF